MILAHEINERIGMDLALELLDVINGDVLLRPELHSVVREWPSYWSMSSEPKRRRPHR